MPSTIIQCEIPDTGTFTLKLYAVNGDTLVNGTGDAITRRTNNKSRGTATVTQALVGIHEYRVTDASDNTIVTGVTEVLVDDTGTYLCHDTLPGTATTDSSGVGAFEVSLTIKLSGGSLVPECDVVLTTSDGDPATDVYASVRSNSSAVCVFNLDAGTYYLWRQKAGFNFTNPATVTVSSAGSATIT